MAVEINGKVYRNLPEQVLKNQEDIESLKTEKVKTFSNPVLVNESASDYFPDPTVWQGDDGFFYATATSTGKHIFRSVDLVNWIDCGYEAIEATAKSIILSGYQKIWAPSVHKVGSRWLMYISAVGISPTARSGIYVLSSNSCCGPFSNPLFIVGGLGTNYIDPFIYNDINNSLWLILGSHDGVYRLQLKADGLSPAGMGIHIAGKTASEDPTRETVFEGSYLYRRNQYVYLFVSSGKYNDASYKLKVGRAAIGSWDFKDKDGNNLIDGLATTILSDNVRGPGHNGNIFVDSLGKTYMFYHARLAGDPSGADRAMYLQELKWDSDDWPYFENGAIAETEVYPFEVKCQNHEIGTDCVVKINDSRIVYGTNLAGEPILLHYTADGATHNTLALRGTKGVVYGQTIESNHAYINYKYLTSHVFMIQGDGSLKIGNTTLTEAQLQALLALLQNK